MCFTQFPHNMVWATIPKALPPAGSEQVEIPPEALENGGMRFRVEATDKAENVNLALSDPLHVKPGLEGARPPSSRLAEAFARTQGPAPGEGVMLAMTQKFTVDTIVPDTILGPKVLGPEPQSALGPIEKKD